MPKKNKKQKREREQQRIGNDMFAEHICHSSSSKRPKQAVKADSNQLTHNNTYDLLPEWYEDIPFTCVDCGTIEIWTAAQQKWWYEVAKGHIHSRAIRCSVCRKKRRDAREAQRLHMQKMAESNAKVKR